MHAVIETPTFRKAATAAGLTDDEVFAIIRTVAGDPFAGDLIPGTGGARKIRVAGRGKGKSGGFRVVTFYAAGLESLATRSLAKHGAQAPNAWRRDGGGEGDEQDRNASRRGGP